MRMSLITKTGMAAAALLVASQAQAFSLNAYSLNTNGDPDASPSYFDISLNLNGDGTATFSVGNLVATGNSTKISDIYLGSGCGSDGMDGFCSIFNINSGVLTFNGVMDYVIDTNPTSGAQIENATGWGAALLSNPTTGNNTALINPGESLDLTFTLINSGTTEADLINAFDPPQDLGIAFHVQKICGTGTTCGGYSEWYSATPGTPPQQVPEPETLGLLGLGLLGLAVIRRRRA